MLISEIIAVALSAIRANKLRSFLTSLGIIIGVSAVIAMVALGTGAQAAVEEQIQNLGADILSVYSGQHFSRGVASANRASNFAISWPTCSLKVSSWIESRLM